MNEREHRCTIRRHRRRGPRGARRVRHADDLQRARAARPGAARPRLHDTGVCLRFRAKARSSAMRAPRRSARRSRWASAAAQRALQNDYYRYIDAGRPLHRRHPGPRRARRATAPSGARSSRRSTSAWARAASSPTDRCATSTNGRRASSSSPAAWRRRTPTRSRSTFGTRSMCSACACARRYSACRSPRRCRRAARAGARRPGGGPRDRGARSANPGSRPRSRLHGGKVIAVFAQLDAIH